MKMKPFDTMKILLVDKGDRSVGIEETVVELTIDANVEFASQIKEKEHREALRKNIEAMSWFFTDMKMQVYFPDELLEIE
jgi:hypothetical protein